MDPQLNTRAKGDLGEDRAVEHLTTVGHRVVHRNYRTQMGEIDIISEAPDGTLVFTEVKAARTLRYGHPLHKVTWSKQKTIATMARHYLAAHKITNRACRFDVISILDEKVEHLKNAFLTGHS